MPQQFELLEKLSIINPKNIENVSEAIQSK